MASDRRNRRNSHHYERGGISYLHTKAGLRYRVIFPADPWGLGWSTHKRATKMFSNLSDAWEWYRQQIDAQDKAHRDGTKWTMPVKGTNWQPGARITFAQFAKSYLDDYRTNNGYGRKPTPETMSNKRHSVAHLNKVIGYKELSHITPGDIVDAMEKLQEHGPGQAHNDSVELKAIMHRAAMKDANGHSLIPYDPAKDVPLPSVPRSRRTKVRPLSAADESALYGWFQARRPEYAAIIPLACNIDIRPQDYLALKVKDVHADTLTLDVVRSQTRVTGKGFVTKPPKTSASAQPRPVARPLMRILEEHIKKFTDGKPESWLFAAPTGGMLIYNTFHNLFRIAARSIGRPEITPYTMRATADDRIARHLVGMNEKELLAMQGRSDEGTSVRHYQRLDPENMHRQAERIWTDSHPIVLAPVMPGDKNAPDSTQPTRAQLMERIDRLTNELDRMKALNEHLLKDMDAATRR